jgi:Raf kinase inhibitor-like YbhB/YbcL family protein
MRGKIMLKNFVLLLASLSLFTFQLSQLHSQTKKWSAKMNITIESPAFKNGEYIPSKYTCDGEDISPALKWSNIPEGTKSLALICDDPDAPIGDWVHWVLYNIPPETRELKEHIPSDKILKDGSIHGLNDWKRYGYGGPCPPSGVHRYFFKLYALDTKLNLGPGATKKQLLDAMKGHIIAQGELMGKYQRKR